MFISSSRSTSIASTKPLRATTVAGWRALATSKRNKFHSKSSVSMVSAKIERNNQRLCAYNGGRYFATGVYYGLYVLNDCNLSERQ